MKSADYSLSEIGRIIGACGEIEQDNVIRELLYDSRKYTGGANSLFFALPTGKNDGHLFIQTLYQRGLRNFVVSKPIDKTHFPEANFLEVVNPLKALQTLAGQHRDRFSYPVVGITGSNGKTIIKEWLFQLLHPNFSIVRSPRSYNSQVGVPLSLWQMKSSHELAIIECGISKLGEMKNLERIVRPTIGIFTNLGPAHQENFKSYGEKLKEKLTLFAHSEVLISCGDQEEVQEEIARSFKGESVTWGMEASCDLRITSIDKKERESTIKATRNGEELSIAIPFVDEAAIENVCHCWALALHLGIDAAEFQKRTPSIAPVAMRLERRRGVNNCQIINDSYNSDLASLSIALDFQNTHAGSLKKAVILSDILQSGEDEQILYAQVADQFRAQGIAVVHGVGPNLSRNAKFFEDFETRFYDTTEDFLKAFRYADYEDTSILVKGARSFRFERIVNRLDLKVHDTVMEIDLNRVSQNLNYTRSLLNPGTKMMVMVKASAYGSGSAELAATLAYHGVEYLAVAYADEGIALREAGIESDIVVLNPVFSAYDSMIRYDLQPQLYSFKSVELFWEALQIHSEKGAYPVHIKINTGMNRLGFELEEIPSLAEILQARTSELRIQTVYSHLAASDDSKSDEVTKKQIARFVEAANALEEAGITGFDKHILNSNGIFRHPEAQFDMVRLGLGLYGLSSNELYRKNLLPIGKLTTIISQIRMVAKGEGVGYNPKKRLTEEKRIGVIAIGYADGIPRALGNGIGAVSINGKKAPFIGNICMDMSMVDLSGIDCNEGDQVEVFGETNSIYELAEKAGTIPYELLTGVSSRVKRVYFKE
jgi:alanine racemase